jgi:hypothetical protein
VLIIEDFFEDNDFMKKGNIVWISTLLFYEKMENLR